MQWGGMTVVDAESVEGLREGGDIGCYVFPEPGIRGGGGAIAQFDAVAPYYDFATEVGFGREESEVLERVSGPYPAVVGEGIFQGVGLRETSEVRLDQRRPRCVS